MVMYVFLEINGYQLDASEVEAVDVMHRLAAGELEEKGLSRWLKANRPQGQRSAVGQAAM